LGGGGGFGRAGAGGCFGARVRFGAEVVELREEVVRLAGLFGGHGEGWDGWERWVRRVNWGNVGLRRRGLVEVR
jgi:hypothetical protein